jgi:tungstate transport system permease protein
VGYFGHSLERALGLILGGDPTVYLAVWTSLKVSLGAVAVATLLAIPLSLLTALKRFAGKRLLLQVLNTLMALPTVVVGLLLYGLLTRRGPLGEFGLLYTPTALVIGECVLILPILWNLCIAALNATDPRLGLTCRALGAGWGQMARVFLAEARFGVAAALAAGFGRAIGEVGIAMMLGGNIGGYTRTMTTAIALETTKGEFELGLALGMLLLAVAFAVNGAVQKLQRMGP